MNRWRNYGSVWALWPSKPIGLIEMIGGSYLASNPQLSYRRLLESLAKKNLAVHAWGYLPNLDHQVQSVEAWKELRATKKILEKRVGTIPDPIRMGHSLGCKLHLLSPDGGRNSKALIAISFNNFKAQNSIPMLKNISKRIGIKSEFSPSPLQTIEQIKSYYIQPNNLIIRFEEDTLDQSHLLLNCLKERKTDNSKQLLLNGDHLTPASVGFREKIFGEWVNNASQIDSISRIVDMTFKISIN